MDVIRLPNIRNKKWHMKLYMVKILEYRCHSAIEFQQKKELVLESRTFSCTPQLTKRIHALNYFSVIMHTGHQTRYL